MDHRASTELPGYSSKTVSILQCQHQIKEVKKDAVEILSRAIFSCYRHFGKTDHSI